MKKIIAVFLSFLIVIALSVTAFAGTDYTFSVKANDHSSITVKPSETVTVKLVVTKSDGTDIELFSLQDYLKFDPNYLRFENANVMTDNSTGREVDVFNAALVNLTGSYDRLFVNRASTSGLMTANEIVVVTVSFTALKEGTTTITHSAIEMLDGDRNRAAVTEEIATVVIKNAGSNGGGSGGTGGGAGGGGGSAGSSIGSPETVQNPDGSVTTTVTDQKTGAVTVITTNKTTDQVTGTVTETKVETVTGKNGTTTSTETVKVTDITGTTGTTTTTTNAKGETTVTAEATVTDKAVTEAAKTGEAVVVPVEVPAAITTEAAAEVKISVPASAGSVAVEVPVTNTGLGVIAVIVKEDGTEEIVKTSIPTENGVALAVEGNATVKIVDNSKYFVDVKSSDWYDNAVTFVAAREIMDGIGDKKFAPNTVLNRGMIAKVLHNFESNPKSNAKNLFNDVKDNTWYTDAVKWAAENKIVEGYNNNYAPNDNITREHLAAILYRYSNVKGYDMSKTSDLTEFNDKDKTSDWAKEAMKWAVGVGLIGGKGNNILDPKGAASRAEVAQIFMNFCVNVAR